jgi:archaellum component FlaC
MSSFSCSPLQDSAKHFTVQCQYTSLIDSVKAVSQLPELCLTYLSATVEYGKTIKNLKEQLQTLETVQTKDALDQQIECSKTAQSCLNKLINSVVKNQNLVQEENRKLSQFITVEVQSLQQRYERCKAAETRVEIALESETRLLASLTQQLNETKEKVDAFVLAYPLACSEFITTYINNTCSKSSDTFNQKENNASVELKNNQLCKQWKQNIDNPFDELSIKLKNINESLTQINPRLKNIEKERVVVKLNYSEINQDLNKFQSELKSQTTVFTNTVKENCIDRFHINAGIFEETMKNTIEELQKLGL